MIQYITGSAVILALIAVIIHGNNALLIKKYVIVTGKTGLNGKSLKICHLSDLHNKGFPLNHRVIVSEIKKAHPDLIAVTGDSVKHEGFNHKNSIKLIKTLAAEYPVFLITGNHEFGYRHYGSFIREIKEAGVHFLENKIVTINKNGKTIMVGGIQDLHFFDDDWEAYTETVGNLKNDDPRTPYIFLAHNPAYFETFKETDADLILTGHTHGGQFRIPGIGGFFAPGQGFFPKYDAGVYQKDGCAMIISRGLGPSTFPIRILNRPEIIFIQLKFVGSSPNLRNS
jgi:uncharacterized protein